MAASPTLDPRIVDQLMLARYELEDGRHELAARTDLGAFKAIKSFHDALETFFIAVADHAGIPRTHRHFHEYPKVIEQSTHHAFKHLAVINEVNSLRVPAKHHALYPHPSAVHAVSGRLNAVFEDNALQYLGHSFFGLSMAASVHHDQARDEVMAAEDAIRRMDFGPALGLLRAAFDIAVGDYLGFGERRLFSRHVEDSVGRIDPLFRSEVTEANRIWNRTVRRLDLLEIGIDLVDYNRFLAITPNVFIPGDHRNRLIYRRPDEPLIATADNAAFALRFVIQSLNRMESWTKSPSSRSFYRIRAKLPTKCFELLSDGSLAEVQTITTGEEVPDARFALGPQGLAGHVWMWGSDSQRVLAPFDAFEIIEEVSERDYYQKKHRTNPTS